MRLLKATLDDIEAMQALVEEEVKTGVVLKRDNDEIATNIRSYILAKEGEVLLGYAALHIHSQRVAEIRSLIVSESVRGQGVGKEIVRSLLVEASVLRVCEDVLVLTYIPEFFSRLGFLVMEKEHIPEHKIWTDCIKCIHFPVCNEVALVYKVKVK
jgi:amino-acid N-acetyltransferase